MNEPATLLPYLSEPGWKIGRTASNSWPRSFTQGEIRIEGGRLLLFDYLADDPKEAFAACPVAEVSVSPVRRWFGSGLALDLGEKGRWYVQPSSLRLKTGRRATERLTEALAEAQHIDN